MGRILSIAFALLSGPVFAGPGPEPTLDHQIARCAGLYWGETRRAVSAQQKAYLDQVADYWLRFAIQNSSAGFVGLSQTAITEEDIWRFNAPLAFYSAQYETRATNCRRLGHDLGLPVPPVG